MTRNVLTRFLICLFIILGISQISKADTQISLIGTKVVVYKGPWNTFTPNAGSRRYTIKNIPRSYQMALQITNFDAATASVTLSNLYCSIDPTVTDFDTTANAGKFTNITFSASGVNVTSSIITLAGGSVFGSGNTIITPSLPCSSITLEFANATQVGTNVEIVATFSDLILGQTNSSGGIGAGSNFNGQVQGVIPAGGNGAVINPLIDGALLPSINASFLTVGLDTVKPQEPIQGFCSPACDVTYTFTPPTPTKATAWGLFFSNTTQFGGGSSIFNPGKWTCIEGSCFTLGTTPTEGQLVYQPNQSTTFNYAFTSVTGPMTLPVIFLNFNNVGAVRQHIGATSPFSPALLLGNSTVIMAIGCSQLPCSIASITDTSGLTWKRVAFATSPIGAFAVPGMEVWMATNGAINGTPTYTVTPNAGTTVGGIKFMELTGISPSSLVSQLTPLQSDANGLLATGGNLVGLIDPCQTPGAIKNSVVINIVSATTTQLVPATSGQSVYSCGFHAVTVGGTFQLEYGTGANCGTGTTTLTGAYPAGTLQYGGAGQSVLKPTPTGNGVCAVSGAGLTNGQGVYSYVLQ